MRRRLGPLEGAGMTSGAPGIGIGIGGIILLLAAVPANAQSAPTSAAVIGRACAGNAGQALTQAEIAEAILIEADMSPAEILSGSRVPTSNSGGHLADAYGAALIAGVRAILAERAPSRRRTAISVGVRTLEQRLNVQPEGVIVERPDDQRIRLFAEGVPAWRVTCKPADPVPDAERPPVAPPRFAVRETPEELWLTGNRRRKAGALSLGFERSRTQLEDGTRKTETSFTIDGTAGVRLTPGSSRDFHTYLFATYNLQRDRTRPPPTLDPGESEGDGDTNALALGLDAHLAGCLGGCSNGLPLDMTLQAGPIFDFANDASRIQFRALLTPRPDWDVGLCRLNSFSAGPLRGRCEVSVEVQMAHILRRGTTELGNYDTFVAAGLNLGVDFFLPTRPGEEADTGFLASVRYRILPVIHGSPDDIERLELRLAHRFWTGANAGIDVGFSYTKGTNPLSFEQEDVLTFGLGIIY